MLKGGTYKLKHPGTWIDNVFYSDIIANKWLSRLMLNQAEQQKLISDPAADPTTEILNDPNHFIANVQNTGNPWD